MRAAGWLVSDSDAGRDGQMDLKKCITILGWAAQKFFFFFVMLLGFEPEIFGVQEHAFEPLGQRGLMQRR